MSDNNEESYQGVYSFELLKTPKLKRGDIDSVRTFLNATRSTPLAGKSAKRTAASRRGEKCFIRLLMHGSWFEWAHSQIRTAYLEHEVTNESLMVDHLKAKLTDTKQEISLGQLFGGVRLDAKIRGPVEKMGQAFQFVENVLENMVLSLHSRRNK